MPRALTMVIATAVGLLSASPALANSDPTEKAPAAPKTVLASDGRPAPDRAGSDNAPEVEPAVHWYGWQTLLVDAAGPAALLTARAAVGPSFPSTVGPAFWVAGASTYALGAPVVHAAHGQWGRAAGSLGLRLGLPLGAALVGYGIAQATFQGGDGGDDHGGARATVLNLFTLGGGLAGAITASFVDAYALAYEPETRASDKPVVAPTVSLVRGGGSVGLAGQF
jgi:hypothetical protein